jgi:hypothetical protein
MEDLENLEDQLFNELESETSNYEEVKLDQPEQGPEPDVQEAEDSEGGGVFLSAPLVVAVADMALSRLGSIGSTWAGVPASIKDYQLTAEERRELAPIVEAWLEFENFEMNPRTALIASVGMLYAGKFAIVRQNVAEKTKAGQSMQAIKKETTKNKGGRPKGSKDTAPRKTRADKGEKKAVEAPKIKNGPDVPTAV